MITLVDAVIKAFDWLGGDPSEAARAADGRSYNGWVNQQAAYTAGSGAAAMAVPIEHLPALVADLAFLMHKMAYCAWGVGAVCGCTPAGKEDFQIILALWSGAISKEELCGAVSGAMVAGGALTTTVMPGANYAIGSAVSKGLPKAVGKGASLATSATLGALAKKVPALASAGLSTQAVSQFASLYTAKLSEKVAGKFAAKIAPKVTAKSVAGFIPVIGAPGGGVNVWLIRGIAASARTYYTELARQEQRTLSATDAIRP